MTLWNNLVDRIKLKDSYRAVFSTPDGERVLRHLMKVGCVTRPAAHQDPNMAQQQLGMQRLVLSIARMVYKDDAELIERLEEGLNNE